VDRPAGYRFVANELGIETIPNWHSSLIADGRATHRVDRTPLYTEETYPAIYWPGDRIADHLEFALKYDGVNLATLATILKVMDPSELQAYIESKPTSKYARKLWFLYEFLTGNELPIGDLTRGNYVDLLEPDDYYTASTPTKVKRQRINNNLLGPADFCPTVRRTETLTAFENQVHVARTSSRRIQKAC